MDDSGRMRRREAVGHADEQFDDLPPRAPLHRGPTTQCAAIHEFRDEVLATVNLADIVHSQNVWMIERRRHLRFALESDARRLVGEIVRRTLTATAR